MAERASDYTVFMTKGSHVVSGAMATRIVDAIRAGASDVAVDVEVFGSRQRSMEMTLVLAHVVSLMKHANTNADVEQGNVRALRR